MGEPVRVLIIEDSEPDAELLVRELEQGGYDPEYGIVDTPEAMAAALDEQSWEVILADYVLPHFGGLDALRMVQERGLDTPFIMVSGKIDEDVAIDTMLAGAQDYVLKSNLPRLVPAVRREIRDTRRRKRANGARKQAEEALQKAYDEQEQRVAERTEELLKANLLLSREIEERKRAEEALRESEERYRTLFGAIDEGFCIIEVIFDENEKPIDYRFLEINPAFERQTGLIDAQGKRMRELAPLHEEHWFRIYGEIALTGRPARFQSRAEQLHRWYDVHAFRFGAPDDRLVAILFDDITERKQAEEELANARAEAERQASQFQSAVSSMADGLVVVDAVGDCVYINEAGRKMLEIPEEALRANWMTGYERYSLDGEPLPQEETVPYRALQGATVTDRRYKLVAPWGKEVTVSASGSPIRDAQGRILGATLVIRDQKERIDLERERQDMYERERHIAEVLQRALIPPMESLMVETCSIAVKYEPALKEAEVGGDFYDFFDLGDGRVGIVIGDVAGKGLVAAVYVAAAKHAIRNYAYLFSSPARIMTLANEALCKGQMEDNGDSSMLTVFLAIVDTRSGTLTYVNAGHDPPVVRDATGNIRDLDGTHDVPLAVACGYEYSEASRGLGSEDIVVIVTDGITEARPNSIELFGKEGIVDFLRRNGEVPVDDIPSGLLEAARSHAEGNLRDDAAIVAFTCDTGRSEGAEDD